MRASSVRVAGIGPVSMRTGSLPARHASTIRACARRPSCSARSAVVSSTADAPSLICDEVPAVWMPSGPMRGLEPGEPFERRLARSLVGVDDTRRPVVVTGNRRVDRHELGLEVTVGARLGGAVLRQLPELVAQSRG